MVFKTHLDLGFTDFAANIEARYFRPFIPSAIRLAKSIRLSGADDRFAWTTGSWLIYEYLEWATAPHT
ncbi:MAG: hypothetical protein P4L33_02100 [Capsulimonadaceae bacterium]|nr:hypothetical protein [Capsulimonadaceae bacterium]